MARQGRGGDQRLTLPRQHGAAEPLEDLPDYGDVCAAASRIAPHATLTPVQQSSALDARCHAKLFFKCENFQRTGAFKFRGACNAVFALDDAVAARGVATHSSGNHAAALALAARLRGISCHVAMPSNAAAVKQAAVAGYGAAVRLCEPTLEARETTLSDIVEEVGATVVHPYDDGRVIAGQGTAAKELIEQAGSLDIVLTPIGGGGLTAGSALAVKALLPEARMVAVEPTGADDAFRSFRAGKRLPSTAPRTIADGLLTSVGERNFALMQRLVDDVVTVSEDAIVAAMRLFWERMKLVVEPSAAVPLAALLEGGLSTPAAAAKPRIGIVLSGGNVDLDRLPW